MPFSDLAIGAIAGALVFALINGWGFVRLVGGRLLSLVLPHLARRTK